MRRWLPLLTLLAMGLALTAPAFAQTVLFGPKQYTRTAGPPNQFTDTFTLPSGTTAPYTLHVVNGNANGTNRISSATVKLNSTQILGPSDFGQNVAVIDRTVSLQASNTLEIRLTSAPGSFITVSVLDTNAGTQPTALTPNPLNLAAGATGTLTATLSPTPTAAGSLVVSSANTAVATVPASVPFAAGQTNVPFTVTAVASGTTTVTVTRNGGSAASQVTVSPPPPTIASFAPTSGRVGDTVTISGTNFVNIQSVAFNGVAAVFTVTNATTITAVVPTGATTGKMTVVDAAGTATSVANFLVLPALTSFTPITVKLGTLVTITGSGFVPIPSSNQVTIGGATAVVQSASSTQLVVTVPVNAVTGPLAVTTTGGTGTSATNLTVIAFSSFAVTPPQATLPIGSQQPFHATATFADQSTLDVTTLTTWTSGASGIASVTSAGVAQGVTLGTTTITGTLSTFTNVAHVQIVAASATPLPPDPSTVATPINPTVATSLADATAFLYTGATPIQTGVAPGTIQAQRVVVLRGSVRGRDGLPLPGVTVTILNHPEYGQTLTRPDGLFDLAVNGGGLLTVTYTKTGFLPVQRQMPTPWREYVTVDEVVLTVLDTHVTPVNLTTPTMQVARGTVVTDAVGTRQATLLFAAGTTGTMLFPNGSTQPLTTLHVRATEYTVGPSIEAALPATLPATFTNEYAVEFTVDEVVAAGATEIQFSQPVISYTENFFDFAVGDPIPTAFFERARGLWVPNVTGRIVKVLSTTGGMADVDTDGDGTADNGLGITTAERTQLATLYPVGQTLTRFTLTHFTTYHSGCNTKTPADAVIPNGVITQVDTPVNDPCTQSNSVIGCENHSLGEFIAVTGAPFQLHYQSDRVRGRTATQRIQVSLSGPTVPASLKRIELETLVAGRQLTQSFSAAPNQSTTVTWDGIDRYGRGVVGPQPAARCGAGDLCL